MSIVVGFGHARRWRDIRESVLPVLRRLPGRLTDHRFWLTQLMVVLIAGTHTLLEAIPANPFVVGLHHVPVVLFLVPVSYAALHFGWEGGILTGVLSALVTLPNLLYWHGANYAWVGEFVETLMVMMVGTVLGGRVEWERRLRRQVQQYASQLTRAQEEERLRVARDLHDDAVQSLALVCRDLDEMMDVGIDERGRKAVLDLRQRAESVVDMLRQFCADLRPSVLDDLGLVAAIQWLLRRLEERTSTSFEFRVSGKERRLDREKELAIFRVAQEALTNIERHARADIVQGHLDFRVDSIEFRLRDDGIGFNVAEMERLPYGQPLGLVGMRERARLVGGETMITSEPGKGTLVRVSVPL